MARAHRSLALVVAGRLEAKMDSWGAGTGEVAGERRAAYLGKLPQGFEELIKGFHFLLRARIAEPGKGYSTRQNAFGIDDPRPDEPENEV